MPFIVGAVFVKDKIYKELHNFSNGIKWNNIIPFLGILLLVVIHSLYESMIIAPITAIAFIGLFNLMDKKFLSKVFWDI